MNIQKAFFTIAAIVLLVWFTGGTFGFGGQPTSSSLNTSNTPAPECSFKIHVLDCNWIQLGGPYTIDQAWPRLKKHNLDNSVFVIDTTDIESYDWKEQRIVLTPQGTSRLIAKLGKNWASVGESAFAVTVDDEWLYGGVFYSENGAAAIQFPVIHLDHKGNRISLRIRPGLGFGFEPLGSWDVIKLEKVKNCFQKIKKLK